MTKEKLRKKLNLNYLTLTNKTHRVGELDFPEIMCPYIVEPDYLALYSEKRNYHKTALTAILSSVRLSILIDAAISFTLLSWL